MQLCMYIQYIVSCDNELNGRRYTMYEASSSLPAAFDALKLFVEVSFLIGQHRVPIEADLQRYISILKISYGNDNIRWVGRYVDRYSR